MVLLLIFLIASLSLAAILKVLAVLLKIEKRTFIDCYIVVIICSLIILPISYFGFQFLINHKLLFFIIKLCIFGSVIFVYLKTEINKAVLVGIVFSLLFNVSSKSNHLLNDSKKIVHETHSQQR